MMLKPTLKINRFVVHRDTEAVYDQTFHSGVNILRGRNSTGKSTIMELIFYALGGEFEEDDWYDEALLCDFVCIEICVNGKLYTLKRDISKDHVAHIQCFAGTYDLGLKRMADWLKFSGRRSDNQMSFSQFIFDLLGFPEIKVKDSDNITMHSLLRMIYCDQTTSIAQIFRHQKSYDRSDLRESIAMFLLGVDDFQLLELNNERRALASKIDMLKGEIRALKQALEVLGEDLSAITIANLVKELDLQKKNLTQEIESLSSVSLEAVSQDNSSALDDLSNDLATWKKEKAKLVEEKDRIAFDILDSENFIEMLKRRLNAIDNSEKTAESLGSISFQYCPSCLTPITPTNENCCHLCKVEIHEDDNADGSLKVRQEMIFQIKESKFLVENRREKLSRMDQQITSASFQIDKLSSEIALYALIPDSRASEIFSKSKKLGYLDRQIEEQQELIQKFNRMNQKAKDVETLSGNLGVLKAQINSLKETQEARLNKVSKEIEKNTLLLLKADRGETDEKDKDYFEEVFRKGEEFYFDFSKDRMSVDGKTKFSASSGAYLKSSFLFSVFLCSTSYSFVRFPRFILLDNIEDKGMQQDRSQNFQETIVQFSKELDVDHQIIFSTSKISPKLNNTPLCVGEFYQPSNKTLKV